MSTSSGFPGTIVSLIIASLLLLTVGIDNASGHLVFPRTSPEGNFINCCHHIPLKYETVENACKYPPMLKLPYPDRTDISHHFTEYIGCYAAHKDNRNCCIEGGVTGDFQVCQDFCDGTRHYDPDQKYYVCVNQRIESVISDCNKAAWPPQRVVPLK